MDAVEPVPDTQETGFVTVAPLHGTMYLVAYGPEGRCMRFAAGSRDKAILGLEDAG
jgi:hypothetical protein